MIEEKSKEGISNKEFPKSKEMSTKKINKTKA